MTEEPPLEEAQPDPDGHLQGAGHDERPAFGVMLHLLGSVALGLAAVIWAALLLFGAVPASTGRFLLAAVVFALAVAWLVWLVRVTAGHGRDDDTFYDHTSFDDEGGRGA